MVKAQEQNVEELFVETEDLGNGVGELLDGDPWVHTMIRSISTTALPLEGTDPFYVVDEEVGAWVAKGYRLVGTHFLGQDPNGFMFAYILSR